VRIYAAIDLRGGEAVQLVGGDPESERIRIPDPAAVARRWLDAGFRHIHVVDLDAALGTGGDGGGNGGGNGGAIEAIASAARGRATLQVGGGLRDIESVAAALALGADRAVVGTRAVEDRPWLEDAVRRFPDQLVVAADMRDGQVVTRGWTGTTGADAIAFAAALNDLPLAAVLVTDVGREGREEGADIDGFRAMAAATRHPLIAAGGITTSADLAGLAAADVAGAVLGMALYSGRLRPADALEFEETA